MENELLKPGDTYNPVEAPPDLTAAISNFRFEKRGSLLSKLFPGKSAEQMVRLYDEVGPGLVGHYLDVKAAMVSTLRWQIQVWEPSTYSWVASKEPLPNTVWFNHFKGTKNESAKSLILLMARDIDSVGQVGLGETTNRQGQVRYEVLPLDAAAHERIGRKQDNLIAFRKHPAAKKPRNVQEAVADDNWSVYDAGKVHRVFQRHPVWANEAYSPILRSLKEIRRYDNIQRAIHRVPASQLALSKLLWFPGRASDYGVAQGKSFKLGHLGRQISEILKYGERSITDYDEGDVASAMPYPIVSENKPELVEVAQAVDPLLLELKEDALKDLARSWNMPQAMITEGPGAAHRLLNEDLQKESFYEMSVMPLAQLIADGLTAVFLVPWLQANAAKFGQLEIEPTNYRIWPVIDKDSAIDPEYVFEMVRLGIMTPEFAAELLNVMAGKLERPPGVTPWDQWLYLNGTDGENPEEETADPVDVTAGLKEWMTKPYG